MSGTGDRNGRGGESGGEDSGNRDYGDSAGYGGGGPALDYDEVLGDTGRGRKLGHNPLDAVIPDSGGSSEDRIRARAYSMWEQAGRPEGREDEFWSEAENEINGANRSGG